MDIGFGLPVVGPWATPANIVEIARKAESLGFSSLWTFQRLVVGVGPDDRPLLPPQYQSVLDPITVLAHAAAVTNTIRLGLGIVNLPFQAPVVLAKQLTTLDILSDGRLDAGLGIGWSQDEFDAVGVPIDRRGARSEDYLRCLRAIWTDEVVEYDGEFCRVPRSRIDPKPVQQPHPPILMGAGAPAALRRIGRVADGWISSSAADVTRLDQSIESVRHAAHAAGRDAGALRFVVRGVVKPAGPGERQLLTGTADDVRGDLPGLADQGATEVFIDLNFDPALVASDADPEQAMARAHELLEGLAPNS